MIPDNEMGLANWIYVLGQLRAIPHPSKKLRATIAHVEDLVHDIVASYKIEDVEEN
jgi:hypothetical protein